MKYLIKMLFVTIILITILPVRDLSADTFDTKTLVSINASTPEERIIVQNLRLEIIDREQNLFKALIKPEHLVQLERAGLSFRVLYDEMAMERAQYALPGYCSDTPWPCYYTPSKFNISDPTPGSIMEFLLNLHNAYPDITKLYDIGDSQDGEFDILAMKVTDNPEIEEYEPEIRIYATIHGDEVSSMMVSCSVLQWILDSYGSETDAQRLVNGAEIWFIPMGNPWGVANQSRYNSRGIDLNRNFYGPAGNEDPPNQPFTETETIAIRDLTEVMGNRFVTSISFHSGATNFNAVYNYTTEPTSDEPIFFSARSGGPWGKALPSEDGLAKAYQEAVTTYGFYFTNGAEWYYTFGDTNDWSYYVWSALDTTIEVTGIKWPNSNHIPFYTEEHRQATINYMLKTFQGISGTMTDAESGQPLDGEVVTVATDSDRIDVPHTYKAVFTDPLLGDFHRVLLPGLYSVECSAPGYETLTLTNIAVEPDATTGITCALQPEQGRRHSRPFAGP